jgi:RimJ/RimL family protein N-acetyltransferase
MQVPSLHTSRLTLRAHALADFDAYAAYWAEDSISRWTGSGRVPTRAESWLKFLLFPGHWELMGYGFWAVVEKSSGALIGEVGFVDLKRDYDARLNEVPEIGWVISVPAQGKGYATEAAQECIRWGTRHFGHIRVLAAVNAENTPSIRVAEKCGFSECLRSEFHGRKAVFFERML